MECYATDRKKELLPFAKGWVEMESIMLCEVSQVVKYKYIFTHLQVEPNEQDKQAKCNQKHLNKEQSESNQRRGWRGIMGESRGRAIKEYI